MYSRVQSEVPIEYVYYITLYNLSIGNWHSIYLKNLVVVRYKIQKDILIKNIYKESEIANLIIQLKVYLYIINN